MNFEASIDSSQLPTMATDFRYDLSSVVSSRSSILILSSVFHDQTKALAPTDPQDLVKASSYLAAILSEGKQANAPTVQEDYLWVRCTQVGST